MMSEFRGPTIRHSITPTMEAAFMLMRRAVTALATLGLGLMLVAEPALAQKKALVVALNQDPDILDPSLARTYVGRIIFSQMCEKLYDIDENLKIFPQLAAALPAFSDGGKTVTIKLRPGVKFNDGTPMNAEAVRFSLDRHLHMKGSNRRSEIELITAIDVVDPLTVRLKLKAPFAPLVAALADRAGMPVSPAQANKLGEKFGTAPVCVGPWSFVERVPQDRIVLEKSAHYFDPGQARFDKLIFRIIPDDNVRLANLRSGDIDFMQRVGPTDSVSLKKEGRFEVATDNAVAGVRGTTFRVDAHADRSVLVRVYAGAVAVASPGQLGGKGSSSGRHEVPGPSQVTKQKYEKLLAAMMQVKAPLAGTAAEAWAMTT
jgi:peptide/nickel transport system substrate-binding protein